MCYNYLSRIWILDTRNVEQAILQMLSSLSFSNIDDKRSEMSKMFPNLLKFPDFSLHLSKL